MFGEGLCCSWLSSILIEAKQDSDKLVSEQAYFLVGDGSSKLAIPSSTIDMEQGFRQAGKKISDGFLPFYG